MADILCIIILELKMNKIKHFLVYWLPVIIWAGVIFKLSSGRLPTVGESYWDDFAFKKFSHVIFYGFFAILNYRALISEKIKKEKALVFAIFISFLYGISDEIHQSFIPSRGPHIRDVFFDTIGAIMAVYLFKGFLERYPKWQKIFW